MAEVFPPDEGTEEKNAPSTNEAEITSLTDNELLLLLIHGVIVNHQSWDHSTLRCALTERCTVYAYDRHGRSQQYCTDSFERGWEDDDVTVVGKGTDRSVTLLGHPEGRIQRLAPSVPIDGLCRHLLHEPAIQGNGGGVGA